MLRLVWFLDLKGGSALVGGIVAMSYVALATAARNAASIRIGRLARVRRLLAFRFGFLGVLLAAARAAMMAVRGLTLARHLSGPAGDPCWSYSV
jgi:hypothetical protein